jgi:hypothetical protein
MKKFNTTEEEQLIALIIYKLFKNPTVLDAYHISKLIGLTENSENIFDGDAPEEELKSWIELGSKVNFSLLEENGRLDELLMSPQSFIDLKTKNVELHKKIGPFRNKASARWSNEWKQIKPKLIAAKSLSIGNPKVESLNLTWGYMLNYCARTLEQINITELAMKIIDLKLEILINRNKSDVKDMY